MRTWSVSKKSAAIPSVILVLLAFVACEQESDDAADELQIEHSADHANGSVSPLYHAAIGAPIDATKAKRWIENHRRTSGHDISFEISAAVLRQILEDRRCVGISLQYGTNDLGALQLVPFGVDSDGRAIANPAISVEAHRLIGRYTGTVKSHFFGRDTFTRLLDERRSENVRATPAISDDRAPQLLLSDAAEKEPRIYEDRSYPCVAACPSLPPSEGT